MRLGQCLARWKRSSNEGPGDPPPPPWGWVWKGWGGGTEGRGACSLLGWGTSQSLWLWSLWLCASSVGVMEADEHSSSWSRCSWELCFLDAAHWMRTSINGR